MKKEVGRVVPVWLIMVGQVTLDAARSRGGERSDYKETTEIGLAYRSERVVVGSVSGQIHLRKRIF